MAITQFIPEIWSPAILSALRDRLVYGAAPVINRNYEGDIARAGDTVHITSFADPAVRNYTKNGSITWDLLTDSSQALIVDQSDYFAFKVDDIDKRQALPGFIEETSAGAAHNLAREVDTYVSGLMAAGTAAGNQVGADTVTAGTSDAYNLLVEFRTLLAKSNTPDAGRFVVVPPEFYGVLLQDDKFIRADAAGTTEGLRNGFVGRAAGFDIYESNTVPTDSTLPDAPVFTILAGHSIATTFANQISSVEGVRLQDTFGDGVKGLSLYGGKVIRPENLASALVTVA